MNRIIIVLSLLLSVLTVNGQNDSIDTTRNKGNNQFKYKSLIIPTVLISYGVVGLNNPTLKDINTSVKNEFRDHDDKSVNWDDYAQYSPFLSVYALNALGIKGKNNFKDRTIVLATAYLIMGSSVNIIKKLQKLKDRMVQTQGRFLQGIPPRLLWVPNFYVRNIKMYRTGMALSAMWSLLVQVFLEWLTKSIG